MRTEGRYRTESQAEGKGGSVVKGRDSKAKTTG